MSDKRPSRLPILLSALVYPGCGQAVQGRRRAAIVVGSIFSMALLVFVVQVVRVLAVYYTLAATFDQPGDVAVPKPGMVVAATVIGILAYLAGVLDAFLAYQRACRKWSARRHGLADIEGLG